jgi:hypothetical protein
VVKELEAIRKRNEELEKLVAKFALELDESKRKALAAENAEKLARAVADEYAKKLESLLTAAAELKAASEKFLGNARPVGADDPKRLALPENLRGQVTRVAADRVELSIGLDAGLEKGAVLDLYRLDGGGKYLGTATVVDVYPKQAVATFRPARKAAIKDLKPEELPKKGDGVRPQPKP